MQKVASRYFLGSRLDGVFVARMSNEKIRGLLESEGTTTTDQGPITNNQRPGENEPQTRSGK